jgi:hypothetical protein
VLAIISSTSVTKDWPVVEVNTALSLEVSGQKKVVPLLVGRPDLSKLPLIRGKDSMVWSDNPEAVAQRLRAAAKGDAPRRPDVSHPDIRAAGSGPKSLATPGEGAEADLAPLELSMHDRGKRKRRGFFGLFGGGKDRDKDRKR